MTASIAGLLLRSAHTSPHAVAVVEHPATVVTYAQLEQQAAAIATRLRELGIQRHDRVVLYGPRGALSAACLFAVSAVGAIAVMASETLRARQVEHICAHSGAVAVLAWGPWQQLAGRPLRTAVPVSVVDWAEPTTPARLEPAAVVGSDVALLIYTSGSTGLPKGVVLSHDNLHAGVAAVTDYLGLRASDRIASLLPFGFDYGLNQLLCAVAIGATLVVVRSPVPERLVNELRATEVTVLAAVPPLWLSLLGTSGFVQDPLPSLRVLTNSGGALPRSAVRRLLACYPQAELYLMYGLTEAFRSTYLDPRLAATKPGSIGRAIPGAEVVVLREDGTPCAPGEVGELVHRGPTVALGYWADPTATAARFRPNPLRPAGAPDSERVVFSGDRVYADEDGDLHFVGRDDRMIKTMGHRVSPDEVADVLFDSGQVLEAVVAAEPDERRGAVIVAYVVYAPDGDPEALRRYAMRELPRYAQPVRYEARAALPRTASGKYDVLAATASRP